MFDSLRQQPRGLTPKDKRRLTISLGAALAVGGIAFGGSKAFFSDAPKDVPQARPKLPSVGPTRDPDLSPLAGVETAHDPNAFDVPALKHLLREVARDRWLRGLSPEARLELIEREKKAAAATEPSEHGPVRPLRDDTVEPMTTGKLLDLPPSRAGTYVEVKGTVRANDPGGFPLPELDGRRVYGLLIEGADGAHVLVLDGEVPHDRRPPPTPDFPADGSKPPPAPPARPPLEVGQLVRARGYVLQRRSGEVGPISLPQPVPVLVGRDYRPSVDPMPVKSPIEVAKSDADDRVVEDTWSVDDFPHFATLYWASQAGHEKLWADAKAGTLPILPWERPQFLKWGSEVRNTSNVGPDARVFTNDSRGKLFRITGVLVGIELEDWEAVDDNAYDVGRRWVYRVISDDYSDRAVLRFDSPFPRETFPGIRRVDPENPQRVRVYGIFLRNHSYELRPPKDPDALARFLASPEKHTTVPSFVAIHMAPDPIGGARPLMENPFFWSWVVLLAFALVFFTVMRVIDRREEARLHEREARIRHAIPGILSSRTPPAPAPSGPSSDAATPREGASLPRDEDVST